MKIIFAFIRAAFHNAYIYRLDFWVYHASVFIMMFASFSLWSILYRQSPNAFGMDLERMTTYGMLGMLLWPIMGTARDIAYYIAEQVRMGLLELDLMKPVDFIFHMFCRNLGEFCVELLMRGVPGILFGYFFLGFIPPVSLVAGLAFLLSLALGYLVFFGINLLMGMLAIVTLDIRSYGWVFWSLTRFASGQMVPLWMFPPALGALVAALPFKDVYFTPMAIYIGVYEGSLMGPLLSQVAWASGLFLAARLIWMRVQRRITVQGG
ncbi:MAG: ABC-2 family transporter protein [Anaerolineales bacterium]|nr:ABC-2 family transporter protein [Anaerolineales bacterium]